TPKPFDQLDITIPAAPAFSSADGSVRELYPVLLMRLRHSAFFSCLSFFIFSSDSFVAYSSQLYSGRPVGCGIEIITNFPFTCGSHCWYAAESARSGNAITSAVTVFRFVEGLHASCIPSRLFTRG